MKSRRHSRADILARMADVNADLAAGVSRQEVCARHQITPQTLRRWLREFGPAAAAAATQPAEAQEPRLRLLETENQRLRREVAKLEIEKQVLMEVARGNY